MEKMDYADLIITGALSAAPLSELRGGLLFALAKNVNPLLAFLIAVIANIFAVFLIFLFLDFLHVRLLKFQAYGRCFDYYAARIRNKVANYGKIKYFTLFLFVAIPSPGTGAYTGTLLSWLLGLDRKKSFIAIALGVVAAGFLTLAFLVGLSSLLKM